MRPQHHIYTSGLGYWLNSAILNTMVLMSDIVEKVRLIINVLHFQIFGS